MTVTVSATPARCGGFAGFAARRERERELPPKPRHHAGENHPLPDTSCECHYEGRTAQEWNKAPKGKKFDSSYDRGSPTSFAPSGVVAGWTEAMQLMVEGDKWEMYIPADLAYGDNGRVPGCLVFTMEIIKIKGGSKPKVKKDD